jgi:hypothetical protein
VAALYCDSHGASCKSSASGHLLSVPPSVGGSYGWDLIINETTAVAVAVVVDGNMPTWLLAVADGLAFAPVDEGCLSAAVIQLVRVSVAQLAVA